MGPIGPCGPVEPLCPAATIVQEAARVEPTLKSDAIEKFVPLEIVTTPSKKFAPVFTARILAPVIKAPCWFVVRTIVPPVEGVTEDVDVTPSYPTPIGPMGPIGPIGP
jgi:hypothetical protein